MPQRRNPGATNLEVDWTLEAAADPRSVVHDPDPKSRSGAVRIIGYSPSEASSSRSSPQAPPTQASPHGRAAAQICATTKGRDDHGQLHNARPTRRRCNRGRDADEEAEAAEREAAENAAALDVSLSLRISRELDDALKRRSAEEQISPSALARRLLRQAPQAENQPVLTTRQVEEIARRIMREPA